MLVLLAAVVTGAMAQTESLLTTITATGKEQASYSTANVATVSFSYTAYGSSAYLANWGWWGYGWSATVTAAEGYTITKCIFYDDANRTATDSEAPFVVETTEEDKTPKVNGTPILEYTSKGIKKIEVYGYENPTTVNVTGITLSQTEAAMTVGGETLTLTATVNPNNATDQSVSWSTSDANVATVENGVVTIKPFEYYNAFRNPMKGWREFFGPGVDPKRPEYPYPYGTIIKEYMQWNMMENVESDGVDKVIAYSDHRWRGMPEKNIKVIPRPFIIWMEPYEGGYAKTIPLQLAATLTPTSSQG